MQEEYLFNQFSLSCLIQCLDFSEETNEIFAIIGLDERAKLLLKLGVIRDICQLVNLGYFRVKDLSRFRIGLTTREAVQVLVFL